jgi:hypothetical protein
MPKKRSKKLPPLQPSEVSMVAAREMLAIPMAMLAMAEEIRKQTELLNRLADRLATAVESLVHKRT